MTIPFVCVKAAVDLMFQDAHVGQADVSTSNRNVKALLFGDIIPIFGQQLIEYDIAHDAILGLPQQVNATTFSRLAATWDGIDAALSFH